ncbi:MAG: YraN family protein [Cyclobacteriaceae bacterium]
MTDKIKRGAEGEELATRFLERKGYEIVERNYRYRHSEIDLIAKKNDWLIFVEVKTRTTVAFGFPEEFVDRAQEAKILEGAEQYIFENDWHGNVRYDIVSVLFSNGEPEIRHFEDAFY